MLHVCTSWSSTFQVRCRRGGGHSRQSAGLRTRADANGSRYADMQLKGQESWQRPRAALVCAPGTEARPQRRTLAAKSFTKSIFCLPRRGRFLRRFLASPARTAAAWADGPRKDPTCARSGPPSPTSAKADIGNSGRSWSKLKRILFVEDVDAASTFKRFHRSRNMLCRAITGARQQLKGAQLVYARSSGVSKNACEQRAEEGATS